MTVTEFKQSKFSEEYSLDVSNIEWGNASNDSHVFDLFSEFCVHCDSSEARLDMLQHVAANNQRYKWDCHIFFAMHKIYLDNWHQKMSYWGTKADELAIYVLSDMLQIHSFIVTLTPQVIYSDPKTLLLSVEKFSWEPSRESWTTGIVFTSWRKKNPKWNKPNR